MLVLSASVASAQRIAPTAREAARILVQAGRLERAFDTLRAVAPESRDPEVWRDLAEVADQLRLDAVALEAYETYLARRADAPDRAEIEGRVRVLRELAAGGRYVVEGNSSRLTRDARVAHNVLVDWYGQPLVLRRSTGTITLADWDGSLRRPGARTPELVPYPAAVEERNLGRRLSTPRAR
jgi:hypothetical protein